MIYLGTCLVTYLNDIRYGFEGARTTIRPWVTALTRDSWFNSGSLHTGGTKLTKDQVL